MKKAFLILLVLAAFFTFCSCGRNADSAAAPEPQRLSVDTAELAGDYRLSALTIDGRDESDSIGTLNTVGLGCSMTVNEDGTGHLTAFGEEEDLVFAGDRMLLFIGKEGFPFSLNGTELSFEYDGREIQMQKQQ